MSLSDLTLHELRVFMGLFKLVVHADRTVSDEERIMIGQLSQALGVAPWNHAVAAARDAYETVEALEADAKRVHRRSAQRLIHGLLSELAHADELVDAEAHVLQWMVQEWGVTEAEDHDTFVLMDDE